MKTYELSYIVSPEITSEEAMARAKDIESAIQSRQGVILKQQNPVAKTLAFPVAKRASGFFGVIEFQIEPEQLLEVKDIVSKDGKIVRHMVIIKEPVRIKKIRRSKAAAAREAAEQSQKLDIGAEVKVEKHEPAFESAKPVETKEKEKVELKDIEEQLDEILG